MHAVIFFLQMTWFDAVETCNLEGDGATLPSIINKYDLVALWSEIQRYGCKQDNQQKAWLSLKNNLNLVLVLNEDICCNNFHVGCSMNITQAHPRFNGLKFG